MKRNFNKTILKILILLIFIIFSVFQVNAQNTDLPDSWNGIWKGETKIEFANGKTENVGVELEIKPFENNPGKQWKITYVFSDRKEVRNYEIKTSGKSANHFVIDEKNGFLIDNFLIGNTLLSQFLINGNIVTTRFSLENKKISIELIMFDSKNVRNTKLTDGKFEIFSYQIKYVQRGILKAVS